MLFDKKIQWTASKLNTENKYCSFFTKDFCLTRQFDVLPIIPASELFTVHLHLQNCLPFKMWKSILEDEQLSQIHNSVFQHCEHEHILKNPYL